VTGVCRTTKIAYPDEATAAVALAEIREAAEQMAPGRKVPVRAYECTYCTEWHLTSKAAKKGARA
jgi:hypothetical protein